MADQTVTEAACCRRSVLCRSAMRGGIGPAGFVADIPVAERAVIAPGRRTGGRRRRRRKRRIEPVGMALGTDRRVALVGVAVRPRSADPRCLGMRRIHAAAVASRRAAAAYPRVAAGKIGPVTALARRESGDGRWRCFCRSPMNIGRCPERLMSARIRIDQRLRPRVAASECLQCENDKRYEDAGSRDYR